MANTIVLNAKGMSGELKASEALYPGHLLEMASATTVQKHSNQGGPNQRMFAKEDVNQGRVPTTAYATNDAVPFIYAIPGDKIQAVIKTGEALTVGQTMLISGGDGTLIAAALPNEPQQVYSSVAASAVVTNTTDETAFDKSYTFAANTLRAGDLLNIKVHATCPSTNSTDTLTIRLKIGSTVLINTGAVDVADADVAVIDCNVLVRTVGAAGTLVAWGDQILDAEGTGMVAQAIAETAVNTTATQAITVTAEWSVANAGNQVQLEALVINLTRALPQHIVAIAEETVATLAADTLCDVRII